ncbi:MAG TPA: hypothetical protein VGD37_23930 [Kofleriaceae bacterium]
MPSFSHEMLVELFRNGDELAPALLDACARITVPHDRVDQASIDLSQVVSTEYRADAVVVLRGGEAAVSAIIVEVQLGIDHDKERTWPVYVTALRAKLGCSTFLLVLATDPRVASWARAPIAIGQPGFQLVPLVIEFRDLPRVTDPDQARRLPELAVLSAMAHPELDVVTAAIPAISELPEDRARLYLDVIMAALSPSLRKQLLETQMQGYVYQSEFARKYYSQGLEEGREQGLEQGLRSAVLALLRAKLDVITAEDEAALAAVHHERGWTELIGALGRATNALEVRAALATARSGGTASPGSTST